MKDSDVDYIAQRLSIDLGDIYRENLRKRLYEKDELLLELGIVSPEEAQTEPTLNDKIVAVSNELRAHSERFTVELIKHLFAEPDDPKAEE